MVTLKKLQVNYKDTFFKLPYVPKFSLFLIIYVILRIKSR
jgi:hypothetical protein